LACFMHNLKMAGRSFGREKNYGLTVTVSSKPWCPPAGSLRLFWREKKVSKQEL
jgi:hypothetical protein